LRQQTTKKGHKERQRRIERQRRKKGREEGRKGGSDGERGRRGRGWVEQVNAETYLLHRPKQYQTILHHSTGRCGPEEIHVAPRDLFILPQQPSSTRGRHNPIRV